jgi:hypothetical protein
MPGAIRLKQKRSPEPFDSIGSGSKTVLTHMIFRLVLRPISSGACIQAHVYLPSTLEARTITAVLTRRDQTVKILGVFVEILRPRILQISALR